MKILIAVALLASCLTASAADWSATNSGPIGNTLNVTSTFDRVDLSWPTEAAPGDQILLTKTTFTRYPGITIYISYVIVGISKEALQVKITGASQRSEGGPLRSDGSFDQTVSLEATTEGRFFLYPEAIKSEGVVAIERSKKHPGKFVVSIARQP